MVQIVLYLVLVVLLFLGTVASIVFVLMSNISKKGKAVIFITGLALVVIDAPIVAYNLISIWLLVNSPL